MEWWLLIFAPFTFWFWTLLVIESFILLACIEKEQGFFATVTLIVTLVLLEQCGGIPILRYVVEHPIPILLSVLAYFAAGTGYGIVKWWFFVTEQRERYESARADFLLEKKVKGDVMPEELKLDWKNYAERGVYGKERFEYRPRARNFKGRILMWMTYWPWSLLWTLINDMVKKLFRHIYYRIAGLLQSISNKAFAGVEDRDFLVQKN